MSTTLSILRKGGADPTFRVDPDGTVWRGIRTPEGTSLETTLLDAERVAREIRETIPETTSTLVTIGDNNERAPNLAKVFVQMTHPSLRKVSQDQVMARVRKDITQGESSIALRQQMHHNPSPERGMTGPPTFSIPK